MHSDKLEQEIARVVQSVNEWDGRTSPDDYPEHLLITSEELAEILRQFSGVLTVTPLEWRTLDNGDAWSKITPVGLMYHATDHGWQHRNGDLNGTAGIEAAKEAAQGDYNARIRAAITVKGTES
jgi:hypothetical protein